MPRNVAEQIKCDFCGNLVLRSSIWRHKETCGKTALCDASELQPAMGFVATAANGVALAKYYVSGIPRSRSGCIKQMWVRLQGCPMVRPQHRGEMKMLGWARRGSSWMPHTFEHKRKANALLRTCYHRIRAFKACHDDRRAMSSSTSFPNFVPPMLPMKAVGGLRGRAVYGTCMVVSRNYVAHKPVAAAAGQHHDPPPQIVAAAAGRYSHSCQDTCVICAGGNCANCEQCCLHLDSTDQSITFGLAFQHRRLTMGKRAWLVLGDDAYMVSGGLAWAMWGAGLLHGIWQDPNEAPRDEFSSFYAMVWVHRMKEPDAAAPAAAPHAAAPAAAPQAAAPAAPAAAPHVAAPAAAPHVAAPAAAPQAAAPAAIPVDSDSMPQEEDSDESDGV